MPRGAWPLALADHYPADAAHLAEYARMAATADGFVAYLDRHVHEQRAASHRDLLSPQEELHVPPIRKVVHADIKPENAPALASRYLDVPNMPWEATKFPGIRIKVLYSDARATP